MRHHDTTARYSLELDMIERDRSTGAALLRSEFGLALNASHFMALSAGDIQVGEIERSVPQEGIARYTVELVLDERRPSMSDVEVADVLEREFALAQNASYFLRIAVEDFNVRLVDRERLGRERVGEMELRAA